MCARCADLEEENAYLRRLLAIDYHAKGEEKLSFALGITLQQSAVIAALYRSTGRFIGSEQIREILPRRTGIDSLEFESTLVKVQVSRIRKTLGRGFIESSYGRGYRLSESGRGRCAQILNQKET